MLKVGIFNNTLYVLKDPCRLGLDARGLRTTKTQISLRISSYASVQTDQRLCYSICYSILGRISCRGHINTQAGGFPQSKS